MPSLLDLYRRRSYPFNDFSRRYSPDDEPTDPFIGAYGSRALTGPPRGSPGGGLPQQAREASPFVLTRERAQRELEDNPVLAQKLDANTTAEVGTNPVKRRGYQAATIDRAVQTGVPLEEVVNNPAYYPKQTTQATTTSGQGVDPSIWAGANPVNYGTGNASYDPKTGRDVGFAGGPQTASIGDERYGIEGQEGVPYAQAMGYTGPARTPIGFGPGAPTGSDESIPVEGATPQAYAAALPRQQQGRKMPDDNSLMSMFQPRDMGGAPIGFGDMLAQRQNSLIGLGLGLMSGTKQDPYGNAMRGYAQGASSDQDRYQTAQAMAQRKVDQARAQANADRSFNEQVRQFNLTAEGGKVPAGWAKGPGGGLAPIPGGPADPKYLQQVAEGKAKPREFSVSDITKLSEEGGKFAQVKGFTDTFEPRFAGYKSSTIGDAANLAGRNVPSLVGKDIAEGATWWQGYDQYKNVVRHELYGGALTPTEVSVFEKANINSGMDPEQIKKNLAIQKEVVQNGLRRKANAMIASGYDPKAISQAYGIPLEDIGVTATGRRGTVAPPTAAPAPAPATATDKPAPKDTGGKVEQRKTVGGKSYSKIDGKWFED